VDTFMLTGDSVFTGIHIACESGMISKDFPILLGRTIDDNGVITWINPFTEEVVCLPSMCEVANSQTALAVTGAVWCALYTKWRQQADEYAPYIRVYGRCTPNDKLSVVDYFVDKGFITMMCGDGGNDCGALKTAHVGVALSDAEASLVSSFTSLDKSITAVVEVLKEGRCCVWSAFASYKFMIMYGQIETILQVVNAYFSITFSDWNWIFLDGIWTISMAFTLPLAYAAKKLGPERPTTSLLGQHTMFSVLGCLGINFLFIVIGLVALNQQSCKLLQNARIRLQAAKRSNSWPIVHTSVYQCRKWNSLDVSNVNTIGDNYESTVLFLVGGFQVRIK